MRIFNRPRTGGTSASKHRSEKAIAAFFAFALAAATLSVALAPSASAAHTIDVSGSCQAGVVVNLTSYISSTSRSKAKDYSLSEAFVVRKSDISKLDMLWAAVPNRLDVLLCAASADGEDYDFNGVALFDLKDWTKLKK